MSQNSAEFAVVLPCVAAVAILVLCLGRASIVSMNCQDAAAAGARAMAIDAGGEAKARAAAQTIAGGGSTVSFAANANSVTVVVRCPVAADPTGVLPASVVRQPFPVIFSVRCSIRHGLRFPNL